jgi:hypothetical protein
MSQHDGGSYWKLNQESREGQERHHMWAQGAFKNVDGLTADNTPSIWMAKEDHRLTASWGNNPRADQYRTAQSAALQQGRYQDAWMMDVKDVRSQFGEKYDRGILQAERQMLVLDRRGNIELDKQFKAELQQRQELSKRLEAAERSKDVTAQQSLKAELKTSLDKSQAVFEAKQREVQRQQQREQRSHDAQAQTTEKTATKEATLQREAKQETAKQQEAMQREAKQTEMRQTEVRQTQAKQADASKQETAAKVDAYYAKRFADQGSASKFADKKVTDPAQQQASAYAQTSKATGQDYYEQRLGPGDPNWVANRPQQLAQQQAREQQRQAAQEQTQTQTSTQQSSSQQQTQTQQQQR